MGKGMNRKFIEKEIERALNENMLNLSQRNENFKYIDGDFPGGAVVKNLPANAGDTGSSPGPGRSHMPQSN